MSFRRVERLTPLVAETIAATRAHLDDLAARGIDLRPGGAGSGGGETFGSPPSPTLAPTTTREVLPCDWLRAFALLEGRDVPDPTGPSAGDRSSNTDRTRPGAGSPGGPHRGRGDSPAPLSHRAALGCRDTGGHE